MEPTLEEQILSAIELFHYSYRFRESIFAIVIDSPAAFEHLLPDLKVLQSSRIRTVIFCRNSGQISESIGSYNTRGYSFDPIVTPLHQTADLLPKRLIRGTMRAGGIPVIALDDTDSATAQACAFYDTAFLIARLLGATKIFFPSLFRGVEIDGVCQSHPSHEEIDRFLSGEFPINIGKPFLRYLHERQLESKMDVIILEAKSGTLFQEIFTHRGAGTLIANEYPNIPRQARASDVSDIALLMKPYIRSGFILPVSEAEILSAIHEYHVFTINGQIVASARITDYGDSAEVGKICALPRYQRKGRARAITERVIALARQQGKKYLFSLSTQDRMMVFFQQLGFHEVARETLPERWKKHYDFTRPSRAFRLDLEPSTTP